MRSEKGMMDLVLSLAEQDERIRIVTLEGSRANINIPKDEFQDYDITYFVSDSTIGIIILLVMFSCIIAVHGPAKRMQSMAITETINEL